MYKQTNKIILLISLLFVFTTNVFAKPRTSSEAFDIANSFKVKVKSPVTRMASESAALKLVYVCTGDSIATRSMNAKPYYYVFNIENNKGFIIVSGDDRAKEILGYSENGSFNITSLPPNFTYWLSTYQKELKTLMEQPEASIASEAQLSSFTDTDNRLTTFAASVAPLLGGIKWDQRSPYNNSCPIIDSYTSERAVTGCVATAMAQIMRYYKWPVKGTGSNTYTPRKFATPLTVDFSQTTYDWANMTETYSSSSTAAQNAAVATLMYHAGVAVNMDYGRESTAGSVGMAKALVANFGYDPNIQIYDRDYYSKAEWMDLIKTELNARRPVLYSGYSSVAGGHQFICDGYDSNGLFHFNWGWSGNSDGYFELSVLTPAALGISDGTNGGFNHNQAIVIGIQKPSSTSVAPPYQLNLYLSLWVYPDSVGRSAPFAFMADIENDGLNSFSGLFGVALYNNNGFVRLLNSTSISSLDTYNFYLYYIYFSMPSDINSGQYKLYSVFQPMGQSGWQIVRGKVGTPNYLNVTVSSSDITFSAPDVLPKLTLNSFTSTTSLYQRKTGKFSVSITNTGGEYNSNLIIQLKSVTNDTISQIVSTDPINIPSGETKSFTLKGDILLPVGKYYLSAMYDPDNNSSTSTAYASLGNPLTVNVLAEASGAAVLTATSKISFPDATKVSKRKAVLTAHIKNTGGNYSGFIAAFVFPQIGGNSLVRFGNQTITLNKDEERTVTFADSINLPPGEYSTEIRYWDATISNWILFIPTVYAKIPFTLVDIGTGIEQTALNKIAIYPNPATDRLYLLSEEVVRKIRIMDISGKQLLLMNPEISGEISIPVDNLSSGTYILLTETSTGIRVNKFIKR
jgi:hypothetical protein